MLNVRYCDIFILVNEIQLLRGDKVNQKQLILMELEHFLKEKESLKKEMPQSKNEIESMKTRQRLIMVNEIIQVKEERLKDL